MIPTIPDLRMLDCVLRDKPGVEFGTCVVLACLRTRRREKEAGRER